FIQIKLIIVGKEKKLTLVDSADRIVTVKKPIKRIVSFTFGFLATMRSLKLEKDKIVGVEGWSIQNKIFFPEFSKLPNVGTLSPFVFNCEKVLELQPDIVILRGIVFSSECEEIQNKLKDANPNIVVLRFECCLPAIYVEEVRKLGYIFDKEEEADEFLEFYSGVLNTINERVEGIPGDKSPKVYLEHTNPYQAHFGKSVYSERLEGAGGKNIFSDVSANIGNVDPEKVITCNPEIVVKVSWPTGGYDTDDITLLSSIRDEIMNRPELANVIAVKNERVYVFNRYVASGATSFVGGAYMAKWCYPELFKDLDPKATHQRYLTEFQGLDYDLDKHGVFVYPEPS
ncbi:MAG: ABC transporter substrate-binding protein, partial [Methanophagales archaeon]|nr:ABC transporter substrate-binding protein [Methanophagales archaeon]